MAEAILVDEKPKWLITEEVGKISIEDVIDLEDEIIKPFPRSAYINRPYEFSAVEELERIIAETKEESFDALYYKVKKIWIKYIAEGDNHLSICAADCIFTYFQDRMGLTHYLFFVGDTTSGKSNNLHIINFLAYRNMLSTDMTVANIYSFLGYEYEGIGTICEDEADDIDEDRTENEDLQKWLYYWH